jgi:hypothetical protein
VERLLRIRDRQRNCLALIKIIGSGTDSDLLLTYREDIYRVARSLENVAGPDYL